MAITRFDGSIPGDSTGFPGLPDNNQYPDAGAEDNASVPRPAPEGGNGPLSISGGRGDGANPAVSGAPGFPGLP